MRISNGCLSLVLVLGLVAWTGVEAGDAPAPSKWHCKITASESPPYWCDNYWLKDCFCKKTCEDEKGSHLEREWTERARSTTENCQAVCENASYTGSMIDNLTLNHIHFAFDWRLPQSQPGCSSCGGGLKSSSMVPQLFLERRHRFRDLTEQSSFGPGVFSNFDITLSIMPNGGANRVRLFNPANFNPRYLDDGLNFRGNGDVKDGIYVDSYTNRIRELRLTTGRSGQGDLVTDIYQAKGASLLTKNGSRFLFDVIDLAPPQPLPVHGASIWQHLDIGAVASKGDALKADASDIDVEGSGANLWDGSDGFRYVYKSVSGDFDIRARIASIQQTSPYAKAGVMVRQNTTAGSIYAMAMAMPGEGFSLQKRTVTGGATVRTNGGATSYPNSWVRLKRKDMVIHAYSATDVSGTAWSEIGQVVLQSNDPVLLGLAVSSRVEGTLCKTEFRDVFLESSALAQNWLSQDIGTATTGTTTELASRETFMVRASGKEIWNQYDEGHLVYQALRGDGVLSARVIGMTRTDDWAKAGVMFRESMSDSSKFAAMFVNPVAASGTGFFWRSTNGANAEKTNGPAVSTPQWVKLERSGNTITGSISADGIAWTPVGSTTVAFGTDIFVGLASTARHDGTVNTCYFDHVTLSGTPTPTNEWPPLNLGNTLAGRLTRIEDQNGYGISLNYKYDPDNPADQTAIAESPERQWQLDTATDAEGRQMAFSYYPTAISGRYAISQIQLPNNEVVQYTYTDGMLSQVQHADGTVSTFSQSVDQETAFTVVSYDDAAAEGTHRRKTAYLSSNFSLYMDGLIDDVPGVLNSASMLVRLVVNGNDEVTYLNVFDKNNPYHWRIYEGQGKLREFSNGRDVRYFKDGWTFTFGQGWNSFQGLQEDTYTQEHSLGDGDNYYLGYLRGRPASVTDRMNVTKQYEYTADDLISKVTYPDGTTEEWSYDSLIQITRYKDRLNRVTKHTYDERGNMLTTEVGLLCVDVPNKTDVAQPEHAVFRLDYYPEGHQHQFLLKTEFDALYDENQADMHRMDYEYNDNHIVSKIIQGADTPGGTRAESILTYDSAGRLETTTDPIGRVTTYHYDSRDRCDKITYNDQTTERIIYGSGPDANLVVKQKDRLGNVTKYEFDNSGRRSGIIEAYAKMDLSDNETPIQDPAISAEETFSYVIGTSLAATRIHSGDLIEMGYDYRHRRNSTSTYPRTGEALTSTSTYVNNLLFCSTDQYGRKTYYAYRDSDSAMVRMVRGLVPSFSLVDYAAVMVLNRDLGNNPDYVIEDYELDAEGQRLATTDAKGIVRRADYDSRGRVVAQVEAYGVADDQDEVGRKSPAAKTTFGYDAQGNRTLVTAPRSFTVDATGTIFTAAATSYLTQMDYNGRNMAKTVTRALGLDEETSESYAYTLDGRLEKRTDGRGNDWMTYYSNCCGYHKADEDPTGAAMFGIRNALNLVTHQYTVDDYDAVTNRSDPGTTLNEITTRYDARLRPEARTVWMVELGSVDKQNPPIAGDTGYPEANGLTTRWTYDESLTDSIGLDATYAAYLTGLGLGANADGSAVLVTAPGGEKTLSIMDGLGRTVRTVHVGADVASSVVVDTVYDATPTVDGKVLVEVKAIRYPNGLNGGVQIVTTSQADGAGLVRQSVDAENQASKMEYDPNANLVKARDPNDVGFNAVFDSRNREIKRFDTLAAGDGGPVRVAYREYDQHSNVVKTQDAREEESTLVYDGLDRRIQTTDRIAGVTTFTYDKNSNLLELKDADAHVAGATQPSTIYRYNSRNLLVLEAYRDQATETNYSTDEADLNQFDVDDRRSYSYDAARRMTGRLDQAGVQTGYAYDRANRLLTRSYPDSLNDTFAFDEDGRLVQATSGRYSNVVARNYDSVGRLVSEQLTIGGQNYTLAYGFDAANRRVSETYPNGQEVTRAYTPRDQLSSVEFDGSPVVSSLIYDLGGRETSRTLGNGVAQSRTWRGDNLPKTIVAPNVLSLGYTWDENKRKLQEDNQTFAAHTNNYTGYDDEDRLTSWQRDGVGDNQSWELSKVGDWNSTTVNGVTETRTHNAVHEILTVTPPNPAAQLVHDVKGNLTHNKNGQDYAWDVENRLAQAIVEAGEPGVEGTHAYAYDALGRRVSKTVDGVTTVFVNNADWQEIAEYQSATLIQGYVFGSYIDEVLCMVKANGDRYWYSTNDLYSGYALTDSNGTVVERYVYDPYGKVTVLDGNGTPRTVNESLYGNPFTFTGRRLDGETGLMYYRNRMYSMELGRFCQRDRIGYEGGMGLYEYVGNVPSRFVDPMGTYKKICYDNPMRQEKCPQNRAEGGCDPIKVAFYFDNRAKAQLAADAKLNGKLPGMEHDKRFGDAVSGNNAIGVSNFNEIGKKGTDKCEGCVCIKKLWIIAHGCDVPDAGKTKFHNAARPPAEFFVNLAAKAKQGESTWAQLGKVLNPLLCKGADIFVISCHGGESKLGEELVTETGGVVHTYEGTWDTSIKGGYTPRMTEFNQLGDYGHREMDSSIGPDGKPKTVKGVDWRPNKDQW